MKSEQSGFTYLGVLLVIALLGAGLVATSEVWTKTAERQRVEQLRWAGAQFVRAIGGYYQFTPGLQKKLPQSLEDLLEDRRFSFTLRHLRAIYVNPLSGQPDWELIRASDGGILGVRVAGTRNINQTPAEFIYVPVRLTPE